MTSLEAYEALPFKQQALVEQLESGLDVADQCFSAIAAMFPDKENVLMLLAKKHAESMHKYYQAKEELEQAGFDETQIMKLRHGFFCAYNEK